ncbi:hypothetical protein HMPREF1410_00564 [Helicobacter pylori GAM249T]|nr:hypothetical protein HMPREF1410_00564 [Helicobacter pylori GAM249T]
MTVPACVLVATLRKKLKAEQEAEQARLKAEQAEQEAKLKAEQANKTNKAWYLAKAVLKNVKCPTAKEDWAS